MTKVTVEARGVEWTNPLTGDGEYCTITFSADKDGDDVELVHVIWERTDENCILRYISSDVREELISNIEEMIADGDFKEFSAEEDEDGSED